MYWTGSEAQYDMPLGPATRRDNMQNINKQSIVCTCVYVTEREIPLNVSLDLTVPSIF